ncbi:MAG TPA: hypothetical protein VFV34_16965 [Blastocatellia bacterium]|nr:hypothetical protein [Blastocatellia bacterium]
MLRIELNRNTVRLAYVTICLLDLLFIISSSPLVGSHYYDPVLGLIQQQLDLRVEANLATWYSSILLFTAGVLAAAGAGRYRRSAGYGNQRFRLVYRAGWLLVALLLFGLSADEVGQVHEQSSTVYNALTRNTGRAPVVPGAGDWVPLLMPAIVASAVGLVTFFILVFRRRTTLLAATMIGMGCWVGSIFSESIESGAWGAVQSLGLQRCIEESLELAGTTLLLIAFAEFLRSNQARSDWPGGIT